MTVIRFVERVEEALQNPAVPPDLANEAAFEQCLVIPTVVEVAKQFPDVRILTHPYLNKKTCQPKCESAEAENIVQGCPKCWQSSKCWATVSAFGMRHTFDVVGKDRDGKTLAIEIKWIGFRGGRVPNGEFQRFLGQCGIAASHHDAVLGICGLRGGNNSKFDEQREKLVKAFREAGVRLAIIRVPPEIE